MTKFNFTRNSKTPKGKLRPTRIVTKGTEAYKIYQLALELQRKDGIRGIIAQFKYVDKATKQIKMEKESNDAK